MYSLFCGWLSLNTCSNAIPSATTDLPVPDGPEQSVISFSQIALMYFFWLTVLAVINDVGRPTAEYLFTTGWGGWNWTCGREL